jgi:hypothetical protein
VLQHFQRVDQVLRELRADQQGPLMLAGARHLQRSTTGRAPIRIWCLPVSTAVPAI